MEIQTDFNFLAKQYLEEKISCQPMVFVGSNRRVALRLGELNGEDIESNTRSMDEATASGGKK